MSTPLSFFLCRRQPMAVVALVALMFAAMASSAAADPPLVAAERRDYLASLGNGTPSAKIATGSRGQAVIAAVPEEARGAFILYQLAEALNATNSRTRPPHPRFAIDVAAYHKEAAEFKSVPVYDNFAEDLLQWAQQHFGLTETDIYGLLRNRSMYCTANGVCYNQEDISCVCCPF